MNNEQLEEGLKLLNQLLDRTANNEQREVIQETIRLVQEFISSS